MIPFKTPICEWCYWTMPGEGPRHVYGEHIRGTVAATADRKPHPLHKMQPSFLSLASLVLAASAVSARTVFSVRSTPLFKVYGLS